MKWIISLFVLLFSLASSLAQFGSGTGSYGTIGAGGAQTNSDNSTYTNIIVSGASKVYSTNLFGTVIGDSAPVGYIGEYYYTNDNVGSDLVTTIVTNVFALTLPPGDWDVQAVGTINATTATATQNKWYLSTTANSIPVINAAGKVTWKYYPYTLTSFIDSTTLDRFQVNTTVTTNVYLNVYLAFTAGSAKAVGHMSARRIR